MASPKPTPTGVVRIWHHFEPGTDTDVHSGLSFAYSGGTPTQANLNTIAGPARSAFSSHLAAYLCSSYGMVDTKVRDLANPTNPYGTDTTEVTGTRSGTAPPNNVTALIYFGLNRVYRGSKPKVWYPFGVDADFNSPTQWSSTFTEDLATAFAAYVAELDGGTAGPITIGGQVGVSYYGPPTIPNTGPGRSKTMSTLRDPPVVTAVDAVTVSTIFGSQRRRLRAG